MQANISRIVTRIEANPLLSRTSTEFVKKKVAAYCRVSTDSEDQLNSYEAQIAYYTEAIAKNPNWTFAGIYADEGITGTATTKRKDFLRLMRDCEKGKVDFILTKSVSRFARNTVDSLMWTRKLRAKGIGVYFEEQAIDSLKAENEMLIGLFSVIAQSESENISANVKWGVQQRMRSGTYMTNFNCYGYRKGDDGIPVIVEEEALIIKKICQLFIDGYSMKQICDRLRSEEVKTYSGKLQWQPEHIQRILTNEKYIGDVLLQKTFRSNCIDKKAKVNRGELPKYLVSNNHPPIIDRDTFNIVQVELARRCSKKSKSDFALTERGKHSGIYALSDILVCGSCGAHYKRKGKTKNGQRIVYWRCINRIEHGTKICKDSIGVEEKKLHAAICRCLSKMMSNRDEVVELIRNNLQYALTGNDSVLDVYAIENQIQSYYDQMSILLDRLYSTGGEAEKYELEIKKINDKIAALREQLSTEKAKATSSDDLNREVERILNYIAQTDKDTFVEYDDVTVRRLVECITVSNDGRIVVTLKGGFRGEEII